MDAKPVRKEATVTTGRAAVSILGLLLAAAPALAQSYGVPTHTVAGGGETSGSGGTYTLGGTIGQAVASSELAGGTYSLIGGFWADRGAQAPPTVTTLPATNITAAGVRLNGTVNPNGSSTTASFDYGLTTSYGSQMSALPVPGSGTSVVAVSATITDLTCDMLYHFRAAATGAGTTHGGDLSFRTAACPPPTVVTLPATNVAATGATLHGTVNPNGSSTTATFEYGLTASYGGQATAVPAPGLGTSPVPVTAAITGLSCDTLYHFRVVGANASATNGSDLTFTTASCAGDDDRLILGLGPYSNDGGWMASRKGGHATFNHAAWFQLPWPAYNATGGGVRVAAGDVDGDGLDEIVAGLGTGSGGWIAIFDDAAHGFALLRWIQVAWPAYNAANGEVWPAIGDLDGDGKAEIVAGLGAGSAGWFEIFDDAAADFAHVAWRQVAWPAYNATGSGATHPAVGNVDGVGANEIILGLGTGSSGWIAVVGGSASSYSHQSWFQVNWAAYNAANGTTFPAAGDTDGDGRAEIVAGLGSGGGGWLAVFDDASSSFAHIRWLRTSWAAYNLSGSGETHPAVGTVDGDSPAEIVVGLDSVPGDGGWFEVFDDGAAGSMSLGWRNVDWAAFRGSGGATFPAIGRFR